MLFSPFQIPKSLNLRVITTIFLFSSFGAIQAQDLELGSVSEYALYIKELATAANKNGQPAEIQIQQEKTIEVQFNYAKSSAADEVYVVGELVGDKGTYFLNVNADGVVGSVVMKGQKEAYEYVMDDSGNISVKSVNVNEILCVNYGSSRSGITAPVDVHTPVVSAIPTDLQSLPGANGCVLLDFDGYYTEGTYWNEGNPINAAHSGMSDEAVRETWEIVSEDFRPFSVNITTNEGVYNSYPRNRRMRCVITPTNTAAPGAGGVAYMGSFAWNDDTPCWVFMLSGKAAGEAASHEIGHCFDLGHDGRHNPEEGYYGGHGDWAPIMGVGYYEGITQWSRGEYNSANNQQDDLSTIASNHFGVGYRNDDHGNGTGSATPLTVEANGLVSGYGVIERNNDRDYYFFSTSGGDINISANTVSRHGNLDILMRLYNASGQEIGVYNPGGLYCNISANLNAGNYYLSVEGTGSGDPVWNGYSDYASLGQYWLSGSLNPGSGNNYGIVTIYRDCEFSGGSGKLMEGQYTLADLQAAGIQNDWISSIEVLPGFEVEVFKNDNFTGDSHIMRLSDNCFVNEGMNDQISSLIVRPNGVPGLSGEYFFRNRFSDMNMDLAAGTLEDGGNIAQWSIDESDNQRFMVEEVEAGVYEIRNKMSGKTLDVAELSIENGANIHQWGFSSTQETHRQFIIIRNSEGYYQLVARHSGKVVEVSAWSTEAGGNIQQWANEGQTSSQWFMVPIKHGVVTFYRDCDFGGYGVNLMEGKYSRGDLIQAGIRDDDLSSLRILPGYVVRVYKDDNQSGDSHYMTKSENCLARYGFNDNVTSVVIRAQGVEGLSGSYSFRNAKSGLNMDLAAGSTENGGNIAQWSIDQSVNQQFELREIEYGAYEIKNVLSNKPLDVGAASIDNGANIQQWGNTADGQRQRQFIIVKTGDFFQLVARHSGRVIEVSDGSMEAGANIQQWDNNDQLTSKWTMVKQQYGVATFFQNCNYGGYGVNLSEGVYSRADLIAAGIWDDDISSIRLLPGFEVRVYADDNQTGSSVHVGQSDNCLVNKGLNDNITSLEIIAKGVSGMSGLYSFRNKSTGLYLDLEQNGNQANGANYLQWEGTGNANQIFELSELGNGVYTIFNQATYKSLDIAGGQVNDGANLQQWDSNTNLPNKQFILVETEDGFYQLVARHSGKVLEVANNDQAMGANIHQFANTGQDHSKWSLEMPLVTELTEPGVNEQFFYPNPARDVIHFSGIATDQTTQIELYTITGELLYAAYLSQHSMDISALPKGVYWVKMKCDGQIQSHKLLKL